MKTLILLVLAVLATTSAFKLADITKRAPPKKDRIVNGQYAVLGQFPYQAGISLHVYAGGYSWCGGSLIGQNWVLTAAHCTFGIIDATVYLGSITRTKGEVQFHVQNNNIFNHKDYNKDRLLNDIALIKIPSFATTSGHIGIVRLPSVSQSQYDFVGQPVLISGWGQTGDNTGITQSLLHGRMNVISNFVCAGYYQGYLTENNICLHSQQGVSTCQGDSGGPMVLETERILIGVTSFGSYYGCNVGHPVAFTRVTKYLYWIKINTGISY